jgi:hypothetical protein
MQVQCASPTVTAGHTVPNSSSFDHLAGMVGHEGQKRQRLGCPSHVAIPAHQPATRFQPTASEGTPIQHDLSGFEASRILAWKFFFSLVTYDPLLRCSCSSKIFFSLIDLQSAPASQLQKQKDTRDVARAMKNAVAYVVCTDLYFEILQPLIAHA